MIETVTRENVTYGAPPHRFEAGTPPIVPAIGLGAALAFMESMDRRAAHAHEAALLAHATEELSRIDGLGIFGTAPGKGALVTFELEGFHAHDVSMLLDRSGIAVRSGSHCAQPLMDHLGVTSTTRASFAVYNTHEDVEALVAGIRKVKEFFG
jgi:cysteine desulfurase/selenocysteine lyase